MRIKKSHQIRDIIFKSTSKFSEHGRYWILNKGETILATGSSQNCYIVAKMPYLHDTLRTSASLLQEIKKCLLNENTLFFAG